MLVLTCDYASPPHRAFKIRETFTLEAMLLACFIQSLEEVLVQISVVILENGVLEAK